MSIVKWWLTRVPDATIMIVTGHFGGHPAFLLSDTSYTTYLSTPHWRRICQASRHLYGGRCVVCHLGLDHHHHLFYSERHVDTQPHHVLPLCAECHSAYHKTAPSGGINHRPSSLKAKLAIISDLFQYVMLGRQVTRPDPVWTRTIKTREQRVCSIFRRLESALSQQKRPSI